MPDQPPPQLACPTPHPPGDRILLAHGEGARLTRRLIREVVLAALENDYLRPLADAALLPAVDGRLVVTTDGFVVTPLFFPGGDIGKLAVHGTVNDLAVSGAEPLYLTLALIVEEGLPLETLRRVIGSVAEAARACGVAVVTGDTKVVPRGAADGLFLTTTGVGRLRPGLELGPDRVRPGDQVLVSGTLGDHGLAVLSAREGLELGSGLESDTAPLHRIAADLLEMGAAVRFLRDPTRGGVAAVLHELCESACVSVELEEASLPISPAVRGACELLGLDPLFVANEGKLLVVVAPDAVDQALERMRLHPEARHACRIGVVRHSVAAPGSGKKTRRGAADYTVGEAREVAVLVRGALKALRVLDEPSGAPLPRIC